MRLGFLRHLYDNSTDNCASVYLATSLAGETTAGEIGLRWRTARKQLADQGADAATLDALGAAVTGPDNRAPGVAAFARAGRVLLERGLPAAPVQEITGYAALPHAMPLVAQAPPGVPHLLVSADRSGGELAVAVGQNAVGATERVEGDGWPVHKPSVGGWSQDRYQRSAEEAWANNEKEFAAAVTAAAERTGAELIVLAGDTRARSLLLDHLGQPLRDKVVVVDKEIAADSNVLAETAAAQIRQRAEQASRDGLDRVRTQLPRGRAVQGLADVVAALRDARVSQLFLTGDPSSTATLWIGPGPAELATSADELRERGTAEPVRDRADAALLRGLVLTDAELFFVPAGEPVPPGGIAALLR
jgi:Bacterial archaeo-eukaryotic release factor family 2